MNPEVNAIYKNYSDFREKSLSGLQVGHQHIQPLLKNAKTAEVEVRQIGTSFKGLPIHKVILGKGSTKVLAWCQMHGDEATATKSFFDLLNIAIQSPELVNLIFDQVTLSIIPMVNPDGANAFTRHNAQGIDLNRDALALRGTESRILHHQFKDVSPNFCLNLHDQKPWYNVGETSKPATLSFLAPGFDNVNSLNDSRLKATKIISSLKKAMLTEFDIGISRYSDSYEPRAFGDFFQSQGVPTILFEAGGYPGDWDREFVREVYFLALVSCLLSIAENSFEDESQEDYFEIPVSEERYFEWIIRGVTIESNGNSWQTDIGGKRDYNASTSGLGLIEEIGDLSGYFGYTEIDGKGHKLAKGKVSDGINVKSLVTAELISNGFTTVQINDTMDLPEGINWQRTKKNHEIYPGHPANLILLKNDEIIKVILNGFIIDPRDITAANYYGVSLD